MKGPSQAMGGRIDLSTIASWIEPGTRVLDLGCGDGTLLGRLKQEKGVACLGVDHNIESISACTEKGIAVVHKDLNSSLACFETLSYDYVILSQTIHQTGSPDLLMAEALRIGRRAIVSFPNFGYWAVRLHLLLKGTMPKSEELPFEWYRTPNIHLTTIADFEELCREKDVRILERTELARRRIRHRPFCSNLLSEAAVFLLEQPARSS